MINLAILNYMFCLLGFGTEMRHYQNNFKKHNIANGKYKNKKHHQQRQSHFKERERPKLVKTSRRGVKDNKYFNDKPFPRDKNYMFQHHRTLHNNIQQPRVVFNPSFHKFW